MRLHTSVLSLVFIAALAITAFFSVVASGQPADDYTRLRDAIQRNEELLREAKELVGRTNSVKARASLETALALQQEAVKLYDAGPNSGRLQLAASIAGKVREVAMQTIALAKKEARLEGDALRAIDRATERYEQAMQILSESGVSIDAVPVKLVDEARAQLSRAQDNMREHLYETAYRLAGSSEELSNQAIAMLKRDSSTPELAERELERTDRFLEDVSREVRSESAANSAALDEATNVQRRAKAQFEKREYGQSIDLTRLARRIAVRASQLSDAEARPDAAQRALRLTDMLIVESRTMASQSRVKEIASAVERAEDLQQQARSRFERADYDAAMRLTSKARDVLRGAIVDEYVRLDQNDVRSALSTTDDELERAGAALAREGARRAMEIFDRALSQQAKAWEEFGHGRLKAALAYTRTARGLAQKALQVAHGAEN
jgi:hypothetical protein